MTASTQSAADLVTTYASAKSRGDLKTAMGVCAADVVIETFAFQITSTTREEAEMQSGALLLVFPDYRAEVEGVLEDGDAVALWGFLSGTMSADIGTIMSTGKQFRVPFSGIWHVSDGAIVRERLYYDLRDVCEQLGISTDRLSAELRDLRPQLEAGAHRDS